jgi:hypothetical protein
MYRQLEAAGRTTITGCYSRAHDWRLEEDECVVKRWVNAWGDGRWPKADSLEFDEQCGYAGDASSKFETATPFTFAPGH